MAHAVLAQCIRRVDGGRRRFREIAEAHLLRPLGMVQTSLGMRADLADRAVTPRVADPSDGLFSADGLVELARMLLDPQQDVEIPAGGFVSTAGDIFRFAEALRQGGMLDERRVLSRAMIALATRCHTGNMPNDLWNYAVEMKNWPEFPANLGLGLFVRGEGLFPTYFGHLSSPQLSARLALARRISGSIRHVR